MSLFYEKSDGNLIGKAAFAVFSGVCGTLLLVVFCAMFVDVYRVLKFLPWMIAFNTAMTGFSLIEKSKDLIVRKHLAAVSAGLVNVVIVAGILTLFSIYATGENLFSVPKYFLLFVLGAGCSEVGAWLAIKDLLRKKG